MDRQEKVALVRIIKVEQGLGRYGCNPRGVQILFKEHSGALESKPYQQYLRKFLEDRGFQVKDGDPVEEGLPFLRLCVTQETGQLKAEDMLAVLQQDPPLTCPGSTRSWKRASPRPLLLLADGRGLPRPTRKGQI